MSYCHNKNKWEGAEKQFVLLYSGNVDATLKCEFILPKPFTLHLKAGPPNTTFSGSHLKLGILSILEYC